MLLSHEDSRNMALTDANTVDTLFLCFFEPTLKDFGKEHILRLLSTPNTEQHPMFDTFLDVYTERLIGFTNKESLSEYDMRLLMEMLQLIEKGMNVSNRYFIQSYLKTKLDKFIHLLNMSEMKFKNTNITKHDLCIQVLKTLSALLANNPQSKVKIFCEKD